MPRGNHIDHTGAHKYCAIHNLTFYDKWYLVIQIVHELSTFPLTNREVNIICVMLYSMGTHVSAKCTDDFFQEHLSIITRGRICALLLLLPKNNTHHKTRHKL